MKVFTKSLFKTGLECPNKLFYTGKPEYHNIKKENTFLNALAQGGFQVEEFAKLHYPDGCHIKKDKSYIKLVDATSELMQQENVVIFEAAFLFNDLFIRSDIINKKGSNLDLIEVKAKSFNPTEAFLFMSTKGQLKSNWKPYFFDLAFQFYVINACYPDLNISSYLFMPDKTKPATVDGLNQMFRISQFGEDRIQVIREEIDMPESGKSVMTKVDVSDIVLDIIDNKIPYNTKQYFTEILDLLQEAYLNDNFLSWPPEYSTCKNCEFKTTNDDKPGLKSGFRNCFTELLNWSESDFDLPNTMDIWNFRKGSTLFNEGIYFMNQLNKENIKLCSATNKISPSQRQWLQIQKTINNDNSIYIEKEGLISEINNWNYPFHFIDFETSAVSLPFHKGRKPYENISFQFSHHVLDKSGTIEHASEFINTEPGEFPNFKFIRALKQALENDHGTIFRFASHENTVLNEIIIQLEESEEQDKFELIDFIKEITKSTNKSKDKWEGIRNMIDLNKVVIDYYYNPLAKGSNSIKNLLPAILNTCEFLKDKYKKPLKQIDVSSKNFPENHIWLVEDNLGAIDNPYNQLGPVFENIEEALYANLLSDIEDIADGGTALTAYAKLQYVEMHEEERHAINKALKKYCELDTLGMVMIIEHMLELVDK